MPSTRGTLVWKLFLCHVLTFVKATEPQCSRFPYEEALLEKMIRMEIRVEQMQESIKATETKVLDSLADLRQEREELTRQFKLKARELDLLADTLTSKTVLFRARDVLDKTPANNQIFVYPIVMDNVGGGYNNDTGIFTAPQKGLYQFSVQLCSTGDFDTNFAFVQDDVVKQRCQLENKGASCGTSIMVTIMEAGSRVWIKSTVTHSNNIFRNEDSYTSNVFTGVLMK